MANPSALNQTVIIVQPAKQESPDLWRASAIIMWPDASCDVGASNLDGKSKVEAERRATDKALERWTRIEHDKTLHKSHDVPGAAFMFLKP